MCVKRVAGHEVALSNGESYKPGVVEIDTNGYVKRAYPLEGEIANTIWLGGRIDITTDSEGKPRAYQGGSEITK